MHRRLILPLYTAFMPLQREHVQKLCSDSFYILLFWLIGNALSILTGGYVSGNIIGMILLFAALCMRWVKAETVRPAAKFLLGAMALFFVPYGVG